MITTNVSYGGNFIVTAEHPEDRGQIPVIWEKKQPGLIPACFLMRMAGAIIAEPDRIPME